MVTLSITPGHYFGLFCVVDSFTRAPHDFPARGNRGLMIREAVDTCAFTIYCLCPVILTENYRKLLTPKEDKLIFLDTSGTPPNGCVSWVESLGQTIIDFVDDDEIQIGMDRIRRTLDQHYRRTTPVTRSEPFSMLLCFFFLMVSSPLCVSHMFVTRV